MDSHAIRDLVGLSAAGGLLVGLGLLALVRAIRELRWARRRARMAAALRQRRVR